MLLNKEYILKLIKEQGWTQTEFAKRLGMSRAEVNRFVNGKRKGGTKLFGSIIKLFPNESLDKLFFLESVQPNGKH